MPCSSEYSDLGQAEVSGLSGLANQVYAGAYIHKTWFHWFCNKSTWDQWSNLCVSARVCVCVCVLACDNDLKQELTLHPEARVKK